MVHTALVFLGAGLGGVCRYWSTNFCDAMFGIKFPFGTLLVNIIGCFFMGLCFILLFEHFDEEQHALASFILIGFLGGFTTFSAFSQQTYALFSKGDISLAFINILFSVLFCLGATFLGTAIGKYSI